MGTWKDSIVPLRIVAYWKLNDGDTWRRCILNRDKQVEKGARNPLNNWYSWNNSDVHAADSLFGILQEHFGKKGIACCIVPGTAASVEEARSCGLRTKHFYSILRVCEEEMDDGSGKVQLILLRNPWSKGEWNGLWSDGCEQWDANPKMKGRLHEKRNDGLFWMSIQDWARMFGKVQLCLLGESHIPDADDPSPDDGADASGDAVAFF